MKVVRKFKLLDAFQYKRSNLKKLKRFVGGRFGYAYYNKVEKCLELRTYDGHVRLEIGDWIVKEDGRLNFYSNKYFQSIFSLQKKGAK